MSQSEYEAQNTYGIVFAFSLLFGPFCWLATLPLTGGIIVVGDVGAQFPEALLFSFVAGLVPGFVGGVVYALLPFRWQRITIAPLIALTPLLPLTIAIGAMSQGSILISLAICAVAALSVAACAGAARMLALDRRGAEKV